MIIICFNFQHLYDAKSGTPQFFFSFSLILEAVFCHAIVSFYWLLGLMTHVFITISRYTGELKQNARFDLLFFIGMEGLFNQNININCYLYFKFIQGHNTCTIWMLLICSLTTAVWCCWSFYKNMHGERRNAGNNTLKAPYCML